MGQHVMSAYLEPIFLLPIFTLLFLIRRRFSLPNMMEAKGKASGEGEIKDAEIKDEAGKMWGI